VHIEGTKHSFAVATFCLMCAVVAAGLILTAADLGVFLAGISYAPTLSKFLQPRKLSLLLGLYLAAALLLGLAGWRVGRTLSAHRQVVVGWSPLAVFLWFLSCELVQLVYYPLPSHPHHLDKLLWVIGGVLIWSLWFNIRPRELARALNSRPYQWLNIALINLLLFILLGETAFRLAT
jgi:hypothetical protein